MVSNCDYNEHNLILFILQCYLYETQYCSGVQITNTYIQYVSVGMIHKKGVIYGGVLFK